MKHFISLSLLSLLILSLPAQAKSVAGFDFNDYPAKIYTGKKAPLKLGDWQIFRKRLKWAHDDGKINFAGNYIVSLWGCGAGCLSGAMVDKRTGNVYDIPIGEETPYDFGCSYEIGNTLEDERLVFYPNSRLFISRNCESKQVGNSNQYIEKYTFFINLWNEKTKKFKLIKTVDKTITTTKD